LPLPRWGVFSGKSPLHVPPLAAVLRAAPISLFTHNTNPANLAIPSYGQKNNPPGPGNISMMCVDRDEIIRL
jgi:hypothetical protein